MTSPCNGCLRRERSDVASGIVDRLAERHRVVVFDRPGYGYTQRPRTRVWTASARRPNSFVER